MMLGSRGRRMPRVEEEEEVEEGREEGREERTE